MSEMTDSVSVPQLTLGWRLQYKTTISSSVNYSTAQEDERQIRVLCGQIGVVPASS